MEGKKEYLLQPEEGSRDYLCHLRGSGVELREIGTYGKGCQSELAVCVNILLCPKLQEHAAVETNTVLTTA